MTIEKYIYIISILIILTAVGKYIDRNVVDEYRNGMYKILAYIIISVMSVGLVFVIF